MSVLVHEQTEDKEQASIASRWTSSSDKWQPHGPGFRHEHETAGNSPRDNGPIRWLEYHHPPLADASGTTGDGAILDESSYDQDESRPFATVNDLLLTGEFTCEGAGSLFFRAGDGDDLFVAQLDIERDCGRLQRNGQSVSMWPTYPLHRNRPQRFAWMLADHQVQLSLNGDVLLRYSFEPTNEKVHAQNTSIVAAPLAIGVRAALVTVEKLAVFRDVFYTPGPPGGATEYQLGPGEYYLLGDNSPHSEDSRWWIEPGVSRRNIVGRVLGW